MQKQIKTLKKYAKKAWKWYLGLTIQLRTVVGAISLLISWFLIGAIFLANSGNSSQQDLALNHLKPIIRVMKIESTSKDIFYKTYGRIIVDTVEVKSFRDSAVVKVNATSGTRLSGGTPVITLLDSIQVRSPISGTVDEVLVVKGDTVHSGQVLFEVTSLSSPVKVEARYIESIRNKVKSKNNIEIEFDGYKCTSKVFFSSINADKTSGTLKAQAYVKDCFADGKKVKNIRKIVSNNKLVKAAISTGKSRAYFIPPYSLQLGDEGNVIISILDKEDRVYSRQVKIIEMLQDGVWITGKNLPHETRILLSGFGYYSEGEKALKISEREAIKSPQSKPSPQNAKQQ